MASILPNSKQSTQEFIAQAKQLIAQAKAENWKHLDIGNYGLTDLETEVPELFELTHLEELVLSNTWEEWNEEEKEWEENRCQHKGEANKLNKLPEGIGRLTNLRDLICGGWEENWSITDLSPLSGLGNLTELRLTQNQITDLSPLSGLGNLTQLDLRHNKIIDLSPLSVLGNLTQLHLSGNQITDLSPLSVLGNLTQLHLDSNQITDLSPLLGLVKLTDLNLGSNQITDLSPLSGLGHLTQLYLYNNQITDLSPLSELGNLTILHLGSNQITNLSPLSRLGNLTILKLWQNQITNLSPLSELENLTILHLGRNQITNLSPLSGLGNLTQLYLYNNQITNLSPLSGLVKLTELDLQSNKITDLSPLLPLLQHKKKPIQVVLEDRYPLIGDINVDGNPLQIPPIEIVRQGTEAVLRYFEDLRSKEVVPNDEIKMILIGNSTAGKSSLSLFLREGKFNENQETTHGIALTDVWKIPQSATTTDQFYNIKLWDFGGQEYYHATHRLFLSKDAVYVLLWETETNKNGTLPTLVYYSDESNPREVMLDHYHYAYWLKTIRYYTKPETIIFLVQNKTDLKKQEPVTSEEYNLLPEHVKAISIKKAFEQSQNERGSEETWLDNFTVFKKQLIQQLKKEISNHKVLRYWLRVRDAVIEQAQKTNTMPLVEFEAFCREHAQEQTPIDFGNLLVYLRDISGLVLYYPNIESLKDTVFINPNWVCTQIYRILDYSVQNNKGEFTFAHAEQKLGSNAHAQQFIALMQQFELIFEKQDEPQTYIAPQYLPKTSVKRDNFIERWQPKLAFKARYANYMPPHFIVRLIARYGADAFQNMYWKQGLAFMHPEFKKYALIEAQTEPNEIALYVLKDGDNTALIQEVFAQLLKLDDHQNFELILEDSTSVEWKKLKREYDPQADIFTNKRRIPCKRFATFMPPTPHQKPPNKMTKKLNVFISYSPEDETFKKALEKHLILLKRSDTIATWDSSNVLAGSELNTTIQKLDNAHIIIILTSANYVADDELWKVHLQRAMNRHDNNEARVIPIKVRDFNSTGLPFAKIQGLPRNGQAIGNPSNDEVWAEVATEISAVVTDMLKNGIGVYEQQPPTQEMKEPKGQDNNTNVTGSGNIVIQGVKDSHINIGTGKTVEPPKPPKQKILFLAANPSDGAHLATDHEYRTIKAEMERGTHRDQYDFLLPQLSLTVNELIRAVKNKPDIIHFSGHGTSLGIFIVTDNNTSQLMPIIALERLFKGLKGYTQLVILNSCYSAEQAKAISKFGMYVIGHNLPIGDDAAISFARGLYVGLSEGKTVEDAFNDAMINLLTTNTNEATVVEVWKDGVKMDW